MTTFVKYIKGCCKRKGNRHLFISVEDRVSSKWPQEDLGLTVEVKKNLMVKDNNSELRQIT